jgi:C-terminal peptidase prc
VSSSRCWPSASSRRRRRTFGGRAGDYAMLDELRQRIHRQHIRGSTASDEELVEYAAKGMLGGLDPHSTLFTSEEYQRFFFDLNREYGGIGAFVNFDQDGDFSIVRPIYSGPAYRAGLRSGDKILEVDGWETAGHTTDEIIKKLKGRPDTPVTLKVFRAGFQKPEEMTIVRQQIAVPAVNWTMVPGNIGYVELISFSQNISQELQVALRDLQGKGAVGIVLDVRNNTGGFLREATAIVEQFLEGEQLVVYTQGPAEERRNYTTSKRKREVCKLPLAILTNNLSASASEITAGALQDLKPSGRDRRALLRQGQRAEPLRPVRSDPAEDYEDLNGDQVWQDRRAVHRPQQERQVRRRLAHQADDRQVLPAERPLPAPRVRQGGPRGQPGWGVMPDKVLDVLETKPEDAWKNTAVFALLKKGVFRDYVKKHMPSTRPAVPRSWPRATAATPSATRSSRRSTRASTRSSPRTTCAAGCATRFATRSATCAVRSTRGSGRWVIRRRTRSCRKPCARCWRRSARTSARTPPTRAC